jgi:hypothetical protein
MAKTVAELEAQLAELQALLAGKGTAKPKAYLVVEAEGKKLAIELKTNGGGLTKEGKKARWHFEPADKCPILGDFGKLYADQAQLSKALKDAK